MCAGCPQISERNSRRCKQSWYLPPNNTRKDYKNCPIYFLGKKTSASTLPTPIRYTKLLTPSCCCHKKTRTLISSTSSCTPSHLAGTESTRPNPIKLEIRTRDVLGKGVSSKNIQSDQRGRAGGGGADYSHHTASTPVGTNSCRRKNPSCRQSPSRKSCNTLSLPLELFVVIRHASED